MHKFTAVTCYILVPSPKIRSSEHARGAIRPSEDDADVLGLAALFM